MKRTLDSFPIVSVFSLLLLSMFLVAYAHADAANKNILMHNAEIDGLRMHYMTAGQGDAVILLHGYAETSLMWRPIMPVLAERFMVIAPDLPGIGDSAIPKDGMDMKTAAIRIHDLVRSLGIKKARVVGHDIGLMAPTPMPLSFPARWRSWW